MNFHTKVGSVRSSIRQSIIVYHLNLTISKNDSSENNIDYHRPIAKQKAAAKLSWSTWCPLQDTSCSWAASRMAPMTTWWEFYIVKILSPNPQWKHSFWKKAKFWNCVRFRSIAISALTAPSPMSLSCTKANALVDLDLSLSPIESWRKILYRKIVSTDPFEDPISSNLILNRKILHH